ncbi:hypothetical protein F383_26160 [Gossypium arboreum]|uniref:Serine-threonine/tyrosine-protein kinase catalytic domain-containing protein n=1 Tax=Gossypium arboreum TaxID=29729 RepID=A0A0B0P7Q0_GOSAR|nr:hypothetical protein F383_26160 [Gossypium arboreum]
MGSAMYDLTTLSSSLMLANKRWEGKTIVDLFAQEFRGRSRDYYIIFLETICNDEKIIERNIHPKIQQSPDYAEEPDFDYITCFKLTEVNYLGQLNHSNLVKLIGYCCEDEHRLLVYEYMASGSLEKHLFRKQTLLPENDGK